MVHNIMLYADLEGRVPDEVLLMIHSVIQFGNSCESMCVKYRIASPKIVLPRCAPRTKEGDSTIYRLSDIVERPHSRATGVDEDLKQSRHYEVVDSEIHAVCTLIY